MAMAALPMVPLTSTTAPIWTVRLKQIALVIR
jgi:hypothetical protein